MDCMEQVMMVLVSMLYGVVDIQVRANDQEPTDIVPKLCIIAYYTLLFFSVRLYYPNH